MEGLQSFKTIAHDGGFVDLEESPNGTVLWLRRQSPDAATNTHQRICIDSVTNSVTVYWMTSLGKVESKTFRTATDLREWLSQSGDKSRSHPEALHTSVKKIPRCATSECYRLRNEAIHDNANISAEEAHSHG